MKIGIIYAMEKEICIHFHTIHKLKKVKHHIHGINVYVSTEKNIVLIESGIGKVSSSIACTILIQMYGVHVVINVGSAGTLQPYIKIHDAIIGEKLSYHDVNLLNFNYPIGKIPGLPKIFQTNKFLNKKIKKILYQNKIRFWEGLIITGDQFIYQNQDINKIKKYFPDAISVDMESTAINQVCFQNNTPVVVIKIISDNSRKESSKLFKKNIQSISHQLKKIITYYIKIIQKFSKHDL